MSDQIIIPINYIERKPGSQKYRIVGKGITVEFLSRLIDAPEWPVFRICENYGLTPAEVHAAWAFYYDHRDEIERTLAEGEAIFNSREVETNEHHQRLKEQYKARTGKPYPDNEN